MPWTIHNNLESIQAHLCASALPSEMQGEVLPFGYVVVAFPLLE